MSVTFEIERITPTKAKQYLEKNTDNYRNPRKGKIEQYARSMRKGMWAVTAEGLKFDKDNTLQDGQHRLLACVAAGKPFRTLVVRGVAPGARLHMDTGAQRKFSDELRFMGYRNVTQLAAVARFCLLYETGEVNRRISFSNGELMEWVEANPLAAEATSFVKNNRIPYRILDTALIAIKLYSTERMPGEFEAFHEQLRTGADLEETNPVLWLRKWCDWNSSGRLARANPEVCRAIVIKAWNAWISGQQVTRQFTYRPGGSKAEEFPTILTSYPGSPDDE